MPAAAKEAELAIVATDPAEVEGAAEISDFRAIITHSPFVPLPDNLSLEGLLADYSLALPAPADCDAALCIGAEAMPADLTMRPGDDVFVGLSFAQQAMPGALPEQSVSLVVVIDRSGSMKGWKLEEVTASLARVLGGLRDGDRVGMVSFGASAKVELPVSPVAEVREQIADILDALEAGEETDMEAGLRLGLDLARAHGAERVVLFTDDLPNIYGERPAGFMALADGAAADGIGLSLVGVDHRYDNATALQLSALSGGRFYEMTPHFDVPGQFEQAWPQLLGAGPESASVILKPGAGRRISAVLGVPEELVERHEDGSVALDLGPAFVAQRGNGVYVTLAPDGQIGGSVGTLLETRLAVTETGETREHSAEVSVGSTSGGLAAAQQLVEEYLVLQASLKAWHEQGNPERAAELAAFLNARMAASDLAFLERERAMVASLAARMAMALGSPPAADLLGRWMVESERGLSGTSQGDIVEFTADRGFIIYRQSGEESGTATRQTYQQGDGKLLIDNTDLVFAYELKGKGRRLDLKAVVGNEKLKLRRVD